MTTKPRQRQTVKPQIDVKVKTTVYLSERSSKMLGVFSLMTNSNNSAVLENLIQEHLRRFVVSDRARASDEATQVISAA